MKRPEKQDNEAVSEYFSGYNQSCNDWEEFLPSIDELHNIIDDYTGISGQIIRKIAIAISRRINNIKKEEKDEENPVLPQKIGGV